MNLILTNFCNGSCPYCFANDAMYGDKAPKEKKEFDFESFEKVLDLLYKEDPNQMVRLLGWEPTRHSGLEEIIQRILKKGFDKILVFSNGIIDDNVISMLKKYRKHLVFVWNINPAEIYPEKINNRIRKSVQELSSKECTLWFNIYSKKYDFSLLFSILEENPIISGIRMGISHPMGSRSKESQKNAIFIEDYPEIGTILYNFVITLSTTKKYSHIERIILDCGHTPCLWTPEQLWELKKHKGFWYGACGEDVVDILADLRVNPCFTRSNDQNPIRYVEDFLSAEKIRKYSTNRDRLAREFLPIVSEACTTCEHRTICDGGCLWERIIIAKRQVSELRYILERPNITTSQKGELLRKIGELLVGCYDYKGAVQSLKESILLPISIEEKENVRNILEKIKNVYI